MDSAGVPVAGAGDVRKLVVTRREVREALRQMADGPLEVLSGRWSGAGSRDEDLGPVAPALVAVIPAVRFRTAPIGFGALGPWCATVGVAALRALDDGFGRGRLRSLEVDLGELRRGGEGATRALALLDQALAHAAHRRAARPPSSRGPTKDDEDQERDDP
ncbi:hypothetical protein [Lichenibacterium ramalinae]|uniref:hypothetical protein n=1 Tax=Lichenibacterium ramalinae TaxID=2316527 RepID=UPI00100FBBAF|nr:hypothetical protein [Lichenibacterium ramalinae]